MSQLKILAFTGSLRKESINDRLLTVACSIATDAGATVNHVQLRNFELPVYDQDLEDAGFPENASKLKELFKQHNALLIACPEYNSSITPVLKNTIDWVSRPTGDDIPLEAFRGKTACLVSASPGALGGLRGLRHVREILSNINVLVAPGQFALMSASDAFNGSGGLVDEKQAQILGDCIRTFVDTAVRQNS